jgi:hypothetical protein
MHSRLQMPPDHDPAEWLQNTPLQDLPPSVSIG